MLLFLTGIQLILEWAQTQVLLTKSCVWLYLSLHMKKEVKPPKKTVIPSWKKWRGGFLNITGLSSQLKSVIQSLIWVQYYSYKKDTSPLRSTCFYARILHSSFSPLTPCCLNLPVSESGKLLIRVKFHLNQYESHESHLVKKQQLLV